MPRIDVAIAIVSSHRRLLICRRRSSDRLGGYWEFPGGKAEPGESIQQCLARELREELDISTQITTALPTIDHDYPDIQVRLHPFVCELEAGDPKPLACDEFRWIEPLELRDYSFPPANKELIDALIVHLS